MRCHPLPLLSSLACSGWAAARSLGLGLALTCFVGTVPARAQVDFAPAVNVATVSFSQDLVTGDFDGDGDLDLGTVGSSQLQVLTNTGNGSFASAGVFAVGSYAVGATVGDLDGDGDLDIAVVTSRGYLSGRDQAVVLLGNGDGTFAAPATDRVGASPFEITSADFDGDRDLDLATVNFGSQNVSVLPNRGDGTFGRVRNFATASAAPRAIAAGDLDGDSDVDLVVGDNYDSAIVLVNNGRGRFANGGTFAVGDFPEAVAVGDLDGDGDLDLATANIGSDDVSVLLNNGNATFAAQRRFAVGDLPNAIAIADFDDDGNLDLAIANQGPDTVAVLLNQGKANFATAQNFGVAVNPIAVVSGDFDGDGDSDLATGNNPSASVSVLLNTTP